MFSEKAEMMHSCANEKLGIPSCLSWVKLLRVFCCKEKLIPVFKMSTEEKITKDSFYFYSLIYLIGYVFIFSCRDACL